MWLYILLLVVFLLIINQIINEITNINNHVNYTLIEGLTNNKNDKFVETDTNDPNNALILIQQNKTNIDDLRNTVKNCDCTKMNEEIKKLETQTEQLSDAVQHIHDSKN